MNVGDKLNPDRVFDYEVLLKALTNFEVKDENWTRVGDFATLIAHSSGFNEARGYRLIVYNANPQYDDLYATWQKKVDDSTDEIISLTGFQDRAKLRAIVSQSNPYDRPDYKMVQMSKQESDDFLRAVKEAGFKVHSHWNGYGANTMSVAILKDNT